MPEIPTFVATQSYGSGTAGGGQIPLSAVTAGGMADGFERAAAQFAAVAEQANRQAAAVEAAKITGEVEMSAAELSQKYANDPDPSTAPQRFRAELQGMHKAATANIQNSRVRSAVEERLSRSGPVAYIHMLTQSAAAQKSLTASNALEDMSKQSLVLSRAPDEASEELAVSGIMGATARAVETGAMTREQGRNAASKALAESVMSLATRDPLAAQAMAERLRARGLIDSTHMLAIENGLKHPLEVREGKAEAHRELGIGGAAGGPGDAAALTRTAAELGIDPVDLATLMSYETGGKMSPSIRGGKNNQHIGLIQFGAEEQKKYGASQGQSFQEQLGAVKAYLLDRGTKPGDDLTTLYRIVNGGNRNVPLTASDGNGTIEQHVGRMSGEHRENARRFLASADEGSARVGPMSQADIDKGAANLATRLAGKPEVLSQALTEYRQQVTLRQAQFKAEQHEISRQVQDVEAKLEAGDESATLPPERIRAAFPAEIAEPMIRSLETSRKAGQVFKGIAFADPAGVAAARAQLAPGNTEDSDDYRHRAQLAAKLDRIIEARNKALNDDPKAYADQSPVVRERMAALKDGGAPARQAYLATLISEQERMGARSPRLTSDAQAAAMAKDIASKGAESAVPTMNKLAAEYGSFWPKAFGEVVKEGKLQDGYIVLGQMNSPKQVSAAADYQTTLKMLAAPGGRDALVKAAESATGGLFGGSVMSTKPATEIDSKLDGIMAPLLKTMVHNGEGGRLAFATYKTAASNLALFYMGRDSLSPGDAAQKAYDGIIGARWETKGTLRYPKEQEADVLRATRQVQDGFKPEDLRIPSLNVFGATGSEEQRGSQWINAVRRGDWIPNQDSTGAYLAVKVANGGYVHVRRQDGAPVELLWNALPSPPADIAPPPVSASGPPPAPVTAPANMPTFDMPVMQ